MCDEETPIDPVFAEAYDAASVLSTELLIKLIKGRNDVTLLATGNFDAVELKNDGSDKFSIQIDFNNSRVKESTKLERLILARNVALGTVNLLEAGVQKARAEEYDDGFEVEEDDEYGEIEDDL